MAFRKSMAVLFDMDGVIVLSNPAHQAAWTAFGREKLGLDITSEMFYSTFSGRKNTEALADLFPGRFTATELEQISLDKEAYYREHFGPQLQPVPGVVELIRELSTPPVSDSTTIALATSGPAENVAFILHRFGVEEAFTIRVNGSHVEKAKPDPAIYLMTAQACNVEPNRCIVLEDAVPGVQAAKRAGMRCLAVTTSETAAVLQEAGADRVVNDFTGIHAPDLRALLD